MSHDRAPCRTMPMRLASRHMHHIAHHQLPRRLAFRTNKSSAHRDGQNLAPLVRVPESASARREADVVAHTRAIVGREDWVHMNRACKSLGRLLGSSVGLVGCADELHIECWVMMSELK